MGIGKVTFEDWQVIRKLQTANIYSRADAILIQKVLFNLFAAIDASPTRLCLVETESASMREFDNSRRQGDLFSDPVDLDS
jgi:hypothetical protein